MNFKEQTMYSVFYDKKYREEFDSNYQNMEEDIRNGKFNLKMEDYVRVYKNFLNKNVCSDLVKDIKEYPKIMEFFGPLSDLLRKGTFVNTYLDDNDFTKKIEKVIEDSIKTIGKKYTDDVRPLYYAYGDEFNHYTYHILKYTSDDYFKIHHDHYAETLNYSRLLTVCVYLNEDYEGGELEVPSAGIDKEYTFKTGDAIVFPSNWMFYHGVKPILSGERYAIVIWIGLDLSQTETKYFSK
jgi:Rps23 Pro-64 3,4-dihydroxylase Tpa1-like proline 4-hydroxylase